MSTSVENRGQFGSKIGFILSAAGSAVGLGNIWKFPGKAYNCGGGAFLLIYILMVVFIGTTVMLGEFVIGRKTQKNAIGAIREIYRRLHYRILYDLRRSHGLLHRKSAGC